MVILNIAEQKAMKTKENPDHEKHVILQHFYYSIIANKSRCLLRPTTIYYMYLSTGMFDLKRKIMLTLNVCMYVLPQLHLYLQFSNEAEKHTYLMV